jgi:O-antigen/teichoic acid export membrane protein
MPVNPYGAARIKSGLAHFLLGKLLSSIATIAYFVLLVRLLPLEEFAAYTVLTGLVDVVGSLSGLGLMHIMQRYIPELYSSHQSSALRSLFGRLLVARMAVLLVFLLAMYFSSRWLAPQLGLAAWQSVFLMYLWVILLRTLSALLFVALESMLHQGSAQFANSLSAFIRLIALLVLAFQGTVSFEAVLWIEICAEIPACIAMMFAFARLVPAADSELHRASGARWMAVNTRRMLDFGLKAYAQSLLVVPVNGAFDRLLIGGRLPSTEIALFGFGQWVYDLMQRFLPAQLLHGLYRPVMNARYSKNQSFSEIVSLSNLILKINIALVGAVAVVFVAGGDGFIRALTGGKFDHNALLLCELMCIYMVVISWRHVLDQVSHTTEHNEALIWSNIVLCVSVIPGLLALPWAGVYALPSAHILGVTAGNFMLLYQLRRHGLVFKHQTGTLLAILLVIALVCAGAVLLKLLGLPWFANIPIVLTAYVLLLICIYPTTAGEFDLVMSLVKNRRFAQSGA